MWKKSVIDLITAHKNGQTKQFTQYAWDLLGENKNGWTKISESNHSISNRAPSANPTVADNNSVQNKANGNAKQPETGEKKTEEPQTFDNPEFLSLAKENLKAGVIKDYLDANEQAYKGNASLDVLVNILCQYMKGDVNALKTEFSI